MKARILFTCLAAIAARTALADDSGYFDNVHASFDAMLSHEAYSGPTAVTVDLDERDVLDTAVYTALGRDVLASLAQAPSPPREEPDTAAARASGQTAGSI